MKNNETPKSETPPEVVKKPTLFQNIGKGIAKVAKKTGRALRIGGKTVSYPVATLVEGSAYTGVSTGVVAIASAINTIILPLVTLTVGLKATVSGIIENTKSALKDGKYCSITMVTIQAVKAMLKKGAPKAELPVKMSFLKKVMGIFQPKAKAHDPDMRDRPIDLTHDLSEEELKALEGTALPAHGFE